MGNMEGLFTKVVLRRGKKTHRCSRRGMPRLPEIESAGSNLVLQVPDDGERHSPLAYLPRFLHSQ